MNPFSERAKVSEPVPGATWIERDRSMALWMHGASSRAWVVGLLQPVSWVGNGKLWYLIVVILPWAGGASGSSAALRMFCVGFVNILIYKIFKKWIARAMPFRTCLNLRESVPCLA